MTKPRRTYHTLTEKDSQRIRCQFGSLSENPCMNNAVICEHVTGMGTLSPLLAFYYRCAEHGPDLCQNCNKNPREDARYCEACLVQGE